MPPTFPVYTRDFHRLPKRRRGQLSPAALAIRRAEVAASLHAQKSPEERHQHALKMLAARWPQLTPEELLHRRVAEAARRLRQLAAEVRGPEGVPSRSPRELAADIRRLARDVEDLGKEAAGL